MYGKSNIRIYDRICYDCKPTLSVCCHTTSAYSVIKPSDSQLLVHSDSEGGGTICVMTQLL